MNIEKMNIKKISLSLAGIMLITIFSAGGLFLLTAKNSTENISSGNLRIVNVNEEKTASLDGISDIKIRVATENINFIKTKDDYIRMDLHGRFFTTSVFNEQYFTVEKDNEKLDIKVSKDILTGLNLFYKNNIKLDIYIPDTYSESLNIISSSAKVNFDALTLKTFMFSSTRGALNAKNIISQNISLITSSGNISLGESECDDFHFSSTRGNFYSKSLFSKKSVFNTSSGKVTIDKYRGNVDYTSTRGDLRINFEKFSNDINIKTSSGNSTIYLPVSSGFNIDFGTSSGKCKSDFEIKLSGMQVRNDIKGTVKDGKNKIIVTTTSGDVFLKENK